MAYKRVQSVPNLMIDYQTFVLLSYLPPEEKDIVIKALLAYANVARKKDAQRIEPSLPSNVSELAREVLDGMIESIEIGFDGYWKMCDRLAKNRNKAEQQNTNDQNGTATNNITNMPHLPYSEQVARSGRGEELKEIIKMLQDGRFAMTKEQCEDIARKMLFENLNMLIAKRCVEVCIRRGIITMGEFFSAFNKIVHEGWDSYAI